MQTQSKNKVKNYAGICITNQIVKIVDRIHAGLRNDEQRADIEALGCNLGNDPPWIEPAAPKLGQLLLAILAMLSRSDRWC